MTMGLITRNINQDMNFLSLALAGLNMHIKHEFQLQTIAFWIACCTARVKFLLWVAFNVQIICFVVYKMTASLKMPLVLIGPHISHYIAIKFGWVCSVGIKCIYTFLQHEEPRHEMSMPLRVLQRNVDSPLNHSTSPSSPCYSRTFRGSPPYR